MRLVKKFKNIHIVMIIQGSFLFSSAADVVITFQPNWRVSSWNGTTPGERPGLGGHKTKLQTQCCTAKFVGQETNGKTSPKADT